MIKAVVFDMDGLLIDSEPLWQHARVAAFGADRLRWTEADQLHIMGSSTIGWAKYLQKRLDNAYSTDEIIDRVLDQMETFYREQVPLMPGAREIIDQLADLYLLGLASGSPYRLLRAALDGANWNGVFAEILSSDDMPQGKPAPDVYLEITRRLDVLPRETAIFEDSANGILAGYAAGAHVIAVPSTYLSPPPDALQKAEVVLASLCDFSPMMLRSM
jgi:HAD superfamily hydrolase (TIGR01509 family)